MNRDKTAGASRASLQNVLVQLLRGFLKVCEFFFGDFGVDPLVKEGLDQLSTLCNCRGTPLVRLTKVLQMLFPRETRAIGSFVPTPVTGGTCGNGIAGVVEAALPLILLNQVFHRHLHPTGESRSWRMAIRATMVEMFLRDRPGLSAQGVGLDVVNLAKVDGAHIGKEGSYRTSGGNSGVEGGHTGQIPSWNWPRQYCCFFAPIEPVRIHSLMRPGIRKSSLPIRRRNGRNVYRIWRFVRPVTLAALATETYGDLLTMRLISSTRCRALFGGEWVSMVPCLILAFFGKWRKFQKIFSSLPSRGFRTLIQRRAVPDSPSFLTCRTRQRSIPASIL